MNRNWIHFVHDGEIVFVLSWTDKLSNEERDKIVNDEKNGNSGVENIKYYLMIWGMKKEFADIVSIKNMEVYNGNVVINNNEELLNLLKLYVEYCNNN